MNRQFLISGFSVPRGGLAAAGLPLLHDLSAHVGRPRRVRRGHSGVSGGARRSPDDAPAPRPPGRSHERDR